MISMDTNDFHNILLRYLRCKAEDVVKIIALDANIERWFQGEMVLAFTRADNAKWKVFSSECYNKFDEAAEKEWNSCITNGGIVTTEASVYKSVKTEKHKAFSIRKVDVLFENNESFILDEMKILWLDEFYKNPKVYLSKKDLLDDAWRLRNNLYDVYWNSQMQLYLYLSLICICEEEANNEISRFKTELTGVLNEYFEEKVIYNIEKQIKIGKICSYNTDANYQKVCPEVYNRQYNYEIQLATVDLS